MKQNYKRILDISEDSMQITLPDSRFYKRNGKYYPSITYVLQAYPKGSHFENWLKQVGFASDYIVKKSSEEGTAVHNLIEQYLEGKTLSFLNKNNQPQYDIEVWQMFLKFVEFWEIYNPVLIESEVLLFSDELKIAGTCDLVCEINNKLWIIDFKTSNHLHNTYDLQTAIYAKCFEECFGKKVDRTGILWLKSSKRRLNKEKMQGKGWEIYESPRSISENIEIFKAVKTIFDIENPNIEPIFNSFQTVVEKK
jgi:hypothetical protein